MEVFFLSLTNQTIMGLFSALLGNAGTVSKEDLTKDFGKLLIEGEDIELGFKLIRDTFIFTSKRLILVDKQGLTGSKTEYKSINYNPAISLSIVFDYFTPAVFLMVRCDLIVL